MAEAKQLKEISQDELEQHGEDADSQWLLINGKVVDVTQYKLVHPGGEDILLENAGTDATESFENVGHGPDARNKLESLVIGTMKSYNPKPPKATPAPTPATTTTPSNDAGGLNVFKHILLPGVILSIIAFVVQKYIA